MSKNFIGIHILPNQPQGGTVTLDGDFDVSFGVRVAVAQVGRFQLGSAGITLQPIGPNMARLTASFRSIEAEHLNLVVRFRDAGLPNPTHKVQTTGFQVNQQFEIDDSNQPIP